MGLDHHDYLDRLSIWKTMLTLGFAIALMVLGAVGLARTDHPTVGEGVISSTRVTLHLPTSTTSTTATTIHPPAKYH